MEDQSEPVQVFVRIRPELDDARGDKNSPNKISVSGSWNGGTKLTIQSATNTCISATDDKTLRLMPPDGVYGTRKNVSAVDDKIYHFDRIFREDCTQEEIYERVTEQVQATVRGYNTTIFAYGVTGSGKSYTMTGNKQCPGIIPRAIGDIFRHIDQSAAENDIFFFVRLSYVELYNNNFRNLLEHVSKEMAHLNKNITNANISMSGFFSELDDMASAAYEAEHGPTFAYARTAAHKEVPTGNRGEKIEVRESSSAGVFLSGPNLRFPVTSAVEAFQLIAKGNKQRAVASTNCNEMSSRSHAILTFHVESRVMVPAGNDGSSKAEMRIGKIHLVDLAGSERLGISGAEGDTLIETKSINSSLTALGDVLSALSRNATIHTQQQKVLKQGAKALDVSLDRQPPTLVPVPYRNSKLTHLLKDSLGGNSKTIMITNIRQANEYYQQTAISLMYAARAKKVRNKSTINRNIIGDSGIHAVNTEFERLKKSLEERTAEFNRLRMLQLKDSKENSALKMRLQEMKIANDAEKRLLEQQVSKLIHSQAGYIASQKEKISHLQVALQDELTISQNRIAEQEQEIKWLKKALDETNNYASKDQIDKMQHVIDVWQNQAKTAHHELTVVLGQAEELKALNAQLSSKITELEHTKKQLSDEVSERAVESAEVTNKLYEVMKEKEDCQELHKSLTKAYDEAKSMLQERMQSIQDQEAVLHENKRLMNSLQSDLQQVKERNQSDQQQLKAAQQRIHELERDKVDLTHKLNAVVEKFEHKSQQMMEDIVQQIQHKEQVVEEVQGQYAQTQDELNALKLAYEEIQMLSEVKLQQKAKALEDMESSLQKELQSNAKLSSQILMVEGENEGLKDKIARMNAKLKEKQDVLQQTASQKDDTIARLEDEMEALKTNFEKQSKAIALDMKHNIEETEALHQQALQDIEAQCKQQVHDKDKQYQTLVKKYHDDMQAQAGEYQHKIEETESKMKAMIDNELDLCVKRLEAQHQQEMDHVLQEEADKLQATVQRLRQEHEANLVKELQKVADDKDKTYQQRIQDLEHELEESFSMEKQSLQDDAKQAIAKLQGKHEKQLQSLQGKLDAQHQQDVEDLQKKHLLALEALRKEHLISLQTEQQRMVDDKQREQEVLVNDLQQKHREALKQLEAELRQNADETLRKRLEEQQQQLVRSHQQALQQLRHDLQELHDAQEQAWLHQQDQSVQQLHEKNQQQQRDALQQQEKDLQEGFETQLAQQEDIFTRKMDLLKKEFAKTLQDQVTESSQAARQQERQEVSQKLQAEHERLLNNAVEEAIANTTIDLLHKHDVKLQQMRQSLVEESQQQMKSLEASFTSMLEDKEGMITQLNQQIKQLVASHHDELSTSLFEQQNALMEKSKHELEKFRQDYAARELAHQTELNAMMQSHGKDILQQRADLEERYEKIIASLKDEHRLLQTRLHDVIEAQSNQQSQDALLKVDLKLKYEDMLHQQQQQSQQQHEEDVQRLQQLAAQETSKLKAQVVQLQHQHEEDMKHVEEHSRQELAKQKAMWKEKVQQEVQQAQRQYEEDVATLRAQLIQQREEDIQRIHDDYQHQLHTKALLLQEVETKATYLQQQVVEITKKLSQEKVEMMESYQGQIQQQVEHAKEALQQVETRYQEVENSAKQRHKQVVDQLRQDYERQLSQQRDDAKVLAEQQENFHQQELMNLKKALQEQHEIRQGEVQRYQEDMELQRQSLSKYQEDIKLLKARYQEEQDRLITQHEEDLRSWKQRLQEEKERVVQLTKDDHEHQRTSLEEAQQRALQSLKDKQERDMLQLQNRMEDLQHQHAQDLSDAKKSYATQLQDMKESHQIEAEKWMTLLKADRNNWDDVQQQLLAEKAQLKLTLEREQNRWQQEHEEALHRIAQKHEEEMQLKVESWQQQQHQVQEEAAYRMEQLEDNYQRKLKRQEEEFLGEQEVWKEKVAEERARNERLSASHQQVMSSLEADHIAEKEQLLQAKTEELEKVKAQHEREVQDMQRMVSQEMQAVKEKLTNASQDADHKIMTIEKHYQSALKSKDAEILALQQHGQQRQLEESQIIAALEARHQRSLQDSRREWEDKHDQLQVQLQDQTQELERKLSREQLEKDRLQSKLQSLEKEVQHYQQVVQDQCQQQDQDLQSQIQEIQQQHQRSIEQLKRHEQLTLQQVQEDFTLESNALRQRVDMLESRNKELEQKVMNKTLQCDTASTDKQDLQLQLQLAQQQVQKLEAQVVQVSQQVDAENVAQVEAKKIQNALQQQVEDLSKELVDKKGEAQQSQQEAQKLSQQLQRVESEHRLSKIDHEKELKEALEQQKQNLQEEHLQSIKQQMDLIVALIQTQSSSSTQSSQQHFQDLQNRFLALIQDLPEIWKEKHKMLLTEIEGLHPASTTASVQDSTSSPPISPRGSRGPNSTVPRTPIRVLANASADYGNQSYAGDRAPYFDEGSIGPNNRMLLPKKGAAAQRGGAAYQPWSSPSLRASPTDQLIAAILDGDVQGIRAVVRSKGEDLQSEFWYDLSRSILPLHRAISGLHFHGSEKLLVATIEVLVQLGADINAVDHAGNSVLHKAILLCTSKSVVAVVNCLISRGANTSVINKEGDTPLHVECKRVRTASVEVIEALIGNGANPNAKNSQSHFLTPLTLVLLRGASTTSIGAAMIAQATQNGGEVNGWNNAWPNVAPNSTDTDMNNEAFTPRSASSTNKWNTNQEIDKTRLTGRKVWIKAAEVLIKSGAHWDASWRSPNHCSQLHLLLAAFPPCREESHTYRALLKSALEDGLNPTAEDDRGRNALFVLCEAMASVAADQSPDSTRLVHYLLEYSSNLNPYYGIGGSDRTGRTIFDIEDTVGHSCLASCRSVLKQASAKSQEVNHLSSTGQHHGALRPQNTLKSGSASNAVSRAASMDWDGDQAASRVPTSVLASNSGSIKPNSIARSRSGDLYNSNVGIAANPSSGSSATGRLYMQGMQDSRGSRIGHYFEEEGDEDDFGSIRSGSGRSHLAAKKTPDLASATSMYSPIVSMRQRK